MTTEGDRIVHEARKPTQSRHISTRAVNPTGSGKSKGFKQVFGQFGGRFFGVFLD